MKKLFALVAFCFSSLSPAAAAAAAGGGAVRAKARLAGIPHQESPVVVFPEYMKLKHHPSLEYSVPSYKNALATGKVRPTPTDIESVRNTISEGEEYFKTLDTIVVEILKRSASPDDIIASISIKDLENIQAPCSLYSAECRGSTRAAPTGLRTENMFVFKRERDDVMRCLGKKVPLSSIGLAASNEEQAALRKLVLRYHKLEGGSNVFTAPVLISDYYAPPSAAPKLSVYEKWLLSKIAAFPCVHEEVSGRMRKMFTDLQSHLSGGMHPIEAASRAHLEFADIHPFSCGNGRTARAFFNIIIMAHGYSPIPFLEELPYQTAVQASLAENSPNAFIDYCLPQMLKAARKEFDALIPKAARTEPAPASRRAPTTRAVAETPIDSRRLEGLLLAATSGKEAVTAIMLAQLESRIKAGAAKSEAARKAMPKLTLPPSATASSGRAGAPAPMTPEPSHEPYDGAVVKNCSRCDKRATIQCARCKKVYCSKKCYAGEYDCPKGRCLTK